MEKNRCWSCRINEIAMKRRPLCRSCYATHIKNHTINRFPLQGKSELAIRHAIEKYGEAFYKHMVLLIYPAYTLKSVGDQYGLSRERIRQLYHLFFNEPYTETMSPKMTMDKRKRIEQRRMTWLVETYRKTNL